MTNRVNHFSLREILSSGRIPTLRLQKSNTLKEKENLHTLGRESIFFRALWTNDLNSAGFTVREFSKTRLSLMIRWYSKKDNHTKYLNYPSGLGHILIIQQFTSHIVF